MTNDLTHWTRTLLVVAATTAFATGVYAAQTSDARQAAPQSASCDFFNGYCRISIHDPLARRIPGNQVLQSGATTGLVTPQVFADATAGKPVTIIKMSFVPAGQGMRALIEWQ